MTGEDRTGAGKAGTRLLLLSLPGENLYVCMCVCKYLCGLFSIVQIGVGWWSEGGLLSTFTSGYQLPGALLALPPLEPLESGDGVLGCGCVDEGSSPPCRVFLFHLAAGSVGAPIQVVKATGGGVDAGAAGAARWWCWRGTGPGRNRGSGCRRARPSFARTAAGHSGSRRPSPPRRSSVKCSPAPRKGWIQNGRVRVLKIN